MRCKVINNQGNVVLQYASSPKNPLDMQIVRLFAQGAPAVFLDFTVMPESRGVQDVHYDVTRLVTLAEKLSQGVSGQMLKNVLLQFGNLIEGCVAVKIPLKNVLLDDKQVYYDSWSSGLKFICLPFQGMQPDLKATQAFFKGMPRRIRCLDEEATALCAAYEGFFLRASNFNPLAFADFLKGLVSTPTASVHAENIQERPVKKSCGTTVISQEMLESVQNPKVEAGRPTTVVEPIDLGKVHARPASSTSASPSKSTTFIGDIDQRQVHARPVSSGKASSHARHADESKSVMEPEKGAAASTETTALESLQNDKSQKIGQHGRVDPGTGVLNPVDLSGLDNLFDDPIVAYKPEDSDGPRKEDGPSSEGKNSEKPDKKKEADPRVNVLPGPRRDGTTPLSLAGIDVLQGGSPVKKVDSLSQSYSHPSKNPQPSLSPVVPPIDLGERASYWLIRKRTGERVRLAGAQFVVGKSKYSSFQVRDTTTVSRRHALFNCESGGCWIEDNESKNGTFVDGERLMPHVRRKLENGSSVRMSDEMFTFEEKRA